MEEMYCFFFVLKKRIHPTVGTMAASLSALNSDHVHTNAALDSGRYTWSCQHGMCAGVSWQEVNSAVMGVGW